MSKKPIRRQNGFTAEQLQQAQEAKKLPSIDATREHVEGIAIDNSLATMAADRDDAVHVEETEHGYRVQVTIADLATRVPADSALGKIAHTRGFTSYRKKRDPMLPQDLANIVSLDPDRERLGVTIQIDLDPNFKPVHTEFKRTQIRAKATHYRGVAEILNAGEGPNRDQYALLEKIASGLTEHHYKEVNIQFDASNEPSSPAIPKNLTMSEFDVQRMNSVFMLLANEQTARLFKQSDLPFLFMNCEEEDRSKLKNNYYATKFIKHTRMNLVDKDDAYANITSPLRRGADFYNQHMMLYATDIMNEIENIVGQIQTETQTQDPKLHEQLWDRAPELLEASQIDADALRSALKRFVADTYPSHKHVLSTALDKMPSNQFAMAPSPLSKHTLSHYADHINQLEKQEALQDRRAQRKWRYKRYLQDAEKVVDELASDDDTTRRAANKTLSSMGTNRFSAVLEYAADSGRMPIILMKEAVRRFQEQDFTKGSHFNPATKTTKTKSEQITNNTRLNPINDAYQVLVAAAPHNDDRWQTLKKEATKSIKNKPKVISQILDEAEEQGALPGKKMTAQVTLPMNGHTLPSEDANYHGAIVGIEVDGQMMAPSFYSLGSNADNALTHATYSFLENLALDRLQPLSQSNIPNLLYAELDDPKKPRIEIIQGMLDSIDAAYEENEIPHAGGGHAIELYIIADKIPELRITGNGESLEEARNEAYKRLLREPIFKDATKALDTQTLDVKKSALIKPQEMLRNICNENKWRMNIKPVQRSAKGKNDVKEYHTTVTITRRGQSPIKKMASDERQQRSIDMACFKALEGLGVIDQKDVEQMPEQAAEGWLMKTLAEQNGHGASSSVA